MRCCTPISKLLMLTTPYAYAYNPVMLAEMPRSHHSSSSSSEDSLLHCTDNEFNTSPEKSSPIKKLDPTLVSPVSLLAACSPPPKFTFGATDVRLQDATKSSSVGDPMVTPRVPLKPPPASPGRSQHFKQPYHYNPRHETNTKVPLSHLL